MKIKLVFHMLWYTFLLSSLIIAPLAIAGPVGFASNNGGTTGGEGDDTITVKNGAALYEALKDKQDSSTSLIIKIDRHKRRYCP